MEVIWTETKKFNCNNHIGVKDQILVILIFYSNLIWCVIELRKYFFL